MYKIKPKSIGHRIHQSLNPIINDTEVIMLKKKLFTLFLLLSFVPFYAYAQEDEEDDTVQQVQELVKQGKTELEAVLAQKKKGKVKVEAFVKPLSILAKARRTMIDFQLQEDNQELQDSIDSLLDLGSQQDEVKDRVKVLRKNLINALNQKDLAAADKALMEMFNLDGKNDKLLTYAAHLINQLTQ